MPPPAILTQFTAADVQRYLRTITAASAADFSPTNLLGTMVTPDLAIDVIAGNSLVRQPGTCRRVQITEFGTEFPLWGLSTTMGVWQGAWVCPTIGAWSSSGSQALLTVERLDVTGIGGYYLGCLRGPNANNPFGNGTTYGTDRGLAKASHGLGLKGCVMYGDEGGGDQDARLFRPNIDQSHLTTSLVGAGFKVEITGYDPNYGGAGVGGGYLWGAIVNQRIWEYYNCDGTPGDPVDDPEGSDPTGAVGSAGNLASPDGRFAFGSVEYGVNTTIAAHQFVSYFGGVLAFCARFEGAAADSIHLHKTTIVEAIQTSIDAAVA